MLLCYCFAWSSGYFWICFFFQISPLGYHHPVWMSSVNDKICIYAEIIFSSTHASPDQIAVHNQYTTRIFTTLFLTSYHEQCPVFFMSFLVCFFFFDSVCVLFFLFLRKVSIGHQLKISKLLIYFRVHTILWFIWHRKRNEYTR